AAQAAAISASDPAGAANAVFASLKPLCTLGWVVFNGSTMGIYQSQNANISKIRAGVYNISLITNPGPVSLGLGGSCGSSTGGNGGIMQPVSVGNYNVVFGCYQSTSGGFQPGDANYISAFLFGNP